MPFNFTAIDLAPKAADFCADVLEGLRQPQKWIAPKYFYDEKGSALFDEICELEEYYVTRTELSIMKKLEPLKVGKKGLAVIELGGACSFKFRRLLEVIPGIETYIAVDISKEALFGATKQLAEDHPALDVLALCADYHQLGEFDFSLYTEELTPVVFFPGSTIGNLCPAEAIALLRICRNITGDHGAMLLGCDLIKPKDVLIPAYNDAKGVTARFNLNLLDRINRELGANFDLDQFRHEAIFNEKEGRIEMHLESLVKQSVTLAGHFFSFGKGETIHTENSCKFDRDNIENLALQAGFALQKWTTDPSEYFAICQLNAIDERPAAREESLARQGFAAARMMGMPL